MGDDLGFVPDVDNADEKFNKASDFTFSKSVEGGFVVDHAGPTNMGIRQDMLDAFNKKHGYAQMDVKDMTPDDRNFFAKKEYFEEPGFAKLPMNTSVAMFDWGLNAGPGTAIKKFQQIIGAKPDGVLGPKTVNSVNEYIKKNGESTLNKKIIEKRQEHYNGLIKRDPATYKQYENGWKNRLKNLGQFIGDGASAILGVSTAHADEIPIEEQVDDFGFVPEQSKEEDFGFVADTKEELGFTPEKAQPRVDSLRDLLTEDAKQAVIPNRTPETIGRGLGRGLGGIIEAGGGLWDLLSQENPEAIKKYNEKYPNETPRVPKAPGENAVTKAGKFLGEKFKPLPEDSPLVYEISAAFGSSLPMIVPGLGIATGAMRAGMGIQKAATLASAFSSVLESGLEAGGVAAELKNKGKKQEDINKSAAATFATNLPLLFVTDKLGGLFDLEKGKSLILKIGKTAFFEGAQEAGQEAISNVATEKPILDNIGKAAALGSLVGGSVGGIMHIATNLDSRDKREQVFQKFNADVQGGVIALYDDQGQPVNIAGKERQVFDTLVAQAEKTVQPKDNIVRDEQGKPIEIGKLEDAPLDPITQAEQHGKVVGIDAKTKLPIIDTTQTPKGASDEKSQEQGQNSQEEVLGEAPAGSEGQQPVSPLHEEAKKYKTAEEFVKIQPEFVSEPAVVINGKTFTGTTHLDATDKAREELAPEMSLEDFVDSNKFTFENDLFVTNKGKVIDQDTAQELTPKREGLRLTGEEASKSKSQLTSIWNEANKPLTQEVKKISTEGLSPNLRYEVEYKQYLLNGGEAPSIPKGLADNPSALKNTQANARLQADIEKSKKFKVTKADLVPTRGPNGEVIWRAYPQESSIESVDPAPVQEIKKDVPKKNKITKPKTFGGIVKQYGGFDFNKSPEVANEDKKGLWLYHRKGAQSADALAQELVSANLLPAGTTGDKLFSKLRQDGGKILAQIVADNTDYQKEYAKWLKEDKNANDPITSEEIKQLEVDLEKEGESKTPEELLNWNDEEQQPTTAETSNAPEITPSGQIRAELRAPEKKSLFQEEGEMFKSDNKESDRKQFWQDQADKQLQKIAANTVQVNKSKTSKNWLYDIGDGMLQPSPYSTREKTVVHAYKEKKAAMEYLQGDYVKDNYEAEKRGLDAIEPLPKPQESGMVKSEVKPNEQTPSVGQSASGTAGESGNRSERGSLPAGSAVESGDVESGRNTDSGSVASRSAEDSQREVVTNYHITESDLLGEGSIKEKYAGNVNAIKLLKKIESENRIATPEEQKALVKYVGWGGLSQAFDRYNWQKEYAELKELLTPEEFDAARRSTINAHYTAPEVIKSIWKAIGNFGFNTGRVLEPSAGVGHFVGLSPQAGKKFSMVELDSLTGRIAKQLYQKSDVQVLGFQDASLPANFFDVIVSNIPFSDFKPFDPKAKQLGIPPNLVLHDYFFAKALAHLKPGGILAFITSKGTMDKASPDFRKFIDGKAKFVGAIRLPSNAFKKNAMTEVITDIIFLQKPMPGEKVSNVNFVDTGMFEKDTARGLKNVNVNKYFLDNPKQVLGDMSIGSGLYSDSELTVTDSGDFQKKLNSAIESLPKDIYGETNTAGDEIAASEPIEDHTALKEFAFTIQGGKIYQKNEGKLIPQDFNPDDTKRISGIINIRDTVRDLLNAERADRDISIINQMRKTLNKDYDSFVSKYGELNTPKNEDIFSDDPDATLLLSLENVKKTGKRTFEYSKGNIFKERVLKPHRKPTTAKDIKDALFVSLGEYGKTDWKYVGELLKKSPTEAQEQALKDNLVFRDPNGDKVVLKDEYLSGNVKAKLKDAEAAAKSDKAYNRNVEELKKVLPADLTFDQIHARIGMPWIRLDTYNTFMRDIGVRGVTLLHNSASGSWELEKARTGYYGYGGIAEYGTARMPAEEIFERVANGKPFKVFDTVYVTGPDGGKVESKVLNEEETALAEQKADLMKDKFSRWIWEDDARREDYVKYYNENWNHTIVRKYDGSHLVFPSMSKTAFPEGLRQTQLSAIWRGITSDRLMLAHSVGAGKTAIMITTAMESKRLGLSNKSMMVAPKNTIPGWKLQINKLYPSAKVLIANEKTFSADKRKKFLSKIALGDWDIVVIPERSFEFIQVSQEAYEEYVNQELDELRAAKEEMKAAGSRISVKNIEKSILQKEAKLKEFLSQSKKDDFLNFEELGVDALYVDEADKFKNLAYTTQKQGIKGMGTATGSMKASDMMMKTNILRKTGGKIVFATGTPISNSMVEAYTQMKYLQPEMLAEAGIKSFDDWSNTFGEVATSSEVDVTGGKYKLVSRFKNFVNVAELMKMIRQVWDIQTQDMLERQGILVKGKNLPLIKGGKPQPIILPSSPDLKAYIGTLIERADAIKKRKGPPQKGQDIMLSVLSDGRNASLDMRLIDPTLKADPNSKIETSIKNIVQDYKDSKKVKGTQVIFIDRVAPDKTSAFNPQYYMKKKLIAAGIPADEIAFIHDFPKEEQKDDLFQKVNDGDIRVLFGSTEKLGAGTNIQERLYSLHHIDVGWRPRDIVQREGRIVRPGNINKEVNIYRYATKGSLDTFMFQLLEAKAKTIDGMMEGQDDIRSITEDDMNDFEALKALSSDNPMVKEKADIDREVKKLRALNNAYIAERGKAQAIVKKAPQEILDAQKMINAIESFKQSRPAKPTKETFEVTIGNKTYTEKEKAFEAIDKVLGDMGLEKKEPVKIGKYLGYDLFANKNVVMDRVDNSLIIKIPGGDYIYGVVSQDPVGTFASLDNSLFGEFSKDLNYYGEKIVSKQNELKYANDMLSKGFDKEQQLQEKIARQSFIEKELQKEVVERGVDLGGEGGFIRIPDLPSSESIKAMENLVKYYAGTKLERWQSIVGEDKGRQIFEMLRFFDRAINLTKAEIERRNIKIFAGIKKEVREQIFEVLKGIRGIDANGIPEFGALQPSGIVSGNEYIGLEGVTLPDGRVVADRSIEIDGNEFQTYKEVDTSKEYADLVKENPRAREIIEKYLSTAEQVKKTMLGTDLPAFSRNVLKSQFGVVSKHPTAFSYVPSLKKEQRIMGKIKNIFRTYTASGRKRKTGALAEAGLEEQDLLKSYTVKQTELSYENLFNDTAGNIMALVLEPIVQRQVKPGYVKVNINHPRVAKITEMKKGLFKANGINPDKLSEFQYPESIERELGLQASQAKFPDQKLQEVYEAFKGAGQTLVGGITTNYLLRPSTANRNFLSGFLQYNLRTLTHLYELRIPEAMQDIKALVGALTPTSRKLIPSEILGGTFYSEINQPKSLFNYALAPFRAIEYYFKRASFLSDINSIARKKFIEQLRQGNVKAKDFPQYREHFMKNYFVDIFQMLSDNSDSVTFDYWNKPYFLEKVPKGFVPFPNYLYHKARMYMEYSPVGLIGINRGNARSKVAKAMAGLTVWLLAWSLADKVAKERKRQLEELAFKRIDLDFDTTGRLRFYADDKVERWLRVYDWPIVGDMLYWREIAQGGADFGDWASDALSLGPLMKLPLITLGFRTKYEAGKRTEALIGDQIAGYIPFGAYMKYSRIIADPTMRQTASDDYSTFQNFINPIVNTIPGASKNLPESVGKTGKEKGQVRKYDISSETMKLLFLNVKSINKQEYMQYVNDQINTGKVEKRIRRKAIEEAKDDLGFIKD